MVENDTILNIASVRFSRFMAKEIKGKESLVPRRPFLESPDN